MAVEAIDPDTMHVGVQCLASVFFAVLLERFKGLVLDSELLARTFSDEIEQLRIARYGSRNEISDCDIAGIDCFHP